MYNLIEYSYYSYGFIQKMTQLILMVILPTLIILNLSCIRLENTEAVWSKLNSKKCNNCCAIKIFK